MDSNSLSHTKWNCKYHIVFAPKYRRKIVYGKLKQDIANILSMLCKRKGVKIVEAEICPDHVRYLKGICLQCASRISCVLLFITQTSLKKLSSFLGFFKYDI